MSRLDAVGVFPQFVVSFLRVVALLRAVVTQEAAVGVSRVDGKVLDVENGS